MGHSDETKNLKDSTGVRAESNVATSHNRDIQARRQSKKLNKSHPVIRFKRVPIVEGKLFEIDKIRPVLLRDVVNQSAAEILPEGVDLLLSEAQYQERARIRKNLKWNLGNLFTLRRTYKDQTLWRGVRKGLRSQISQVDRQMLLRKVLWHYAEEIGGHFDPKVYEFATHAVPYGFNWFLNAVSVRAFFPKNMTESLEDRLRITGEVPHLQKLAQKGTVLLVPTHQSNIDSVLIGSIVYLMSMPPFSYGAGLNLFKNPVLSYFMSRLGAYTVDREKSNPLYKHVLKHYSTRILKEGVHSIFFPGGGRSSSGAIESHLKLGLLGTGLQAQLENLMLGKPNPNIYIVPMVVSYHYVLEAASLIERYLASSGKHLFLGTETDESWKVWSVLRFFFKFFSSKSDITIRIGKPLDVFGNFVDEEGRSIGPNGTFIDAKKWFTTQGELKSDTNRDFEYTRLLGQRIVSRFYSENTVLTSHMVAFSFFSTLRTKYPDLDIYRFLRLSEAQRKIPYENFLKEAQILDEKVRKASDDSKLHLSDELKRFKTEEWILDGIRHLGYLHGSKVVKIKNKFITTDDMNLLYYYRNRLSGYGFSTIGNLGRPLILRGEQDEKGFLG